jgi:CBS domain-containing protein
MSTNLVKCSENSTVDEVMEMMTQRRFRHVPVEENGKLTGIISIGDVIKSHIREIELQAEHLQAYIAS